MTLGLHLSTAHRATHEDQQGIREAKRWMKERIREDWRYQTLPQYASSGTAGLPPPVQVPAASDSVAGFQFHVSREDGREGGEGVLGLDFDPLRWREREYTSESEGGDDGKSGTSGSHATKEGSGGHGAEEERYKFEGPESVGSQLAMQRDSRKRKWQRALAEEIQWNEGLAHWTQRRDAWCGARSAADVRSLEQSAQNPSASTLDTATDSSTPRTSTSSTSDPLESSPATSLSSVNSALSKASLNDSATPTGLTVATMATTTTTMTTRRQRTAQVPPRSTSMHLRDDTIIPMAPPILPNHPVRRRIDQKAYPEIYSKIIVQSRTPSIPINLRTLIGALVQGWQADDEWPPKPGPLERSIGRKRNHHQQDGPLRQGVKAVGRALRITGTSEPSTSKK